MRECPAVCYKVTLGLAGTLWCREVWTLKSTCFNTSQTCVCTCTCLKKGRKGAGWRGRCGCRFILDRCWCEGSICYLAAQQMRCLAAVLLHLRCASRWPDGTARHCWQHLSFPSQQDWSKDTVWSTALVDHCPSLRVLHFCVHWISLFWVAVLRSS